MDFGTYHHSNPDESREMRNRVAGAFSAVLLTLYEPHSEIRILDAGCGLGFHNLGRRRFAGYENVFAVLKRKGYFVIVDFFPNDKADTKFLTSFSELIEDGHGEGLNCYHQRLYYVVE